MSVQARGSNKQLAQKVPARYSKGPIIRRSAIPKIHRADTRHSAGVWVKVGIRVRVSLRISGNSRLSE